ncbi:hypothetical protein B0H19DRAFT_1271444 [Mycena capillaripes]|nr:hypothetical protein B0H19DRAFT_1271444 [Mycena capillaripes]
MGMVDRFRDEVLPKHNEVRQDLWKTSGGTADYAAVLLIAANIGPDALEVEGNHPITMRFSPVDILQSNISTMSVENYEGDWLQDLKDQVHNDFPVKYLAPSQV